MHHRTQLAQVDKVKEGEKQRLVHHHHPLQKLKAQDPKGEKDELFGYLMLIKADHPEQWSDL